MSFSTFSTQEDLFRAVIQLSPLGVAMVDSTGKIFMCNKALASMLGYCVQELDGLSFEQFTHPEDLEREWALIKELWEGKTDHYQIEKRYITKTGETIWVRVAGALHNKEHKDGWFGFAFVEDITTRKEMESELARQRRILSQTLDAATDGIWMWDFKQNQMYFSPRYYAMLGYEPDEFPASYENWAALIHPDDREEALRHAENYLAAKSDIYENEFRLKTKSGGYIWIHTKAKMVERDEHGEPVLMIGNHEDISRRKEAELELRRSKEMFSAIFHNSPDAVSITEVNTGVLVEVNPGFEKLMETTRVAVLGRSTLDLGMWGDPQDRKIVLALVEEKGQVRDFPIAVRSRSGRLFDAEISMSVIEFAGSKHLLCIVRDVSERKELHERLLQAQKLESIGSLAGGIAHDFNNILFPILGMAELLLDDIPPGHPGREALQTIFNASRRGSDLVKQILAFGRQSGEQKAPVALQGVLREATKLSRSTIPSDIGISSRIKRDCGPVLADATQMHQIAMNLVTNAYHAVQEKGGSIFLGLEEVALDSGGTPGQDLAQGRYAVLTVKDDGCGIDPDHMDKVFEPYFTTKEKGKGTGLGLAMVYGIARDHGGDVRIESQVGEGTSVKVYLPVISQPAQSLEPAPQEEPKGNGERILLVDDEEAIVSLVSKMLMRLGYAVTLCTEGPEAWRLFEEEPGAFDLVLTDMTMPKLTGDQLAGKCIALRPDIPVIICTGFSEKIDREKAEAQGIRDYLMKPVIRSELARMVRNALDAPQG